MAKFQRRYSSAQNAAIIAAQLDLGWSAAVAQRAAVAGELPEPGKPGAFLPAFEIPVHTARDKAGDERRRRKTEEVAKGGASAELAAIVGKLMIAAGKEADRIARKQAAGVVMPERIAAAARMTREIAQLVRELDKAPVTRTAAPAGDAPANGTDGGWLADVAQRAAG